ncbi:hypothetical protein [Bordetella avium]|uniref:hypothetical protein n=1 Tax=Bordetella avium TaxID=521 RepID=UPI0013E3BC30|nr:hypothetical protein [Bordetella avium]
MTDTAVIVSGETIPDSVKNKIKLSGSTSLTIKNGGSLSPADWITLPGASAKVNVTGAGSTLTTGEVQILERVGQASRSKTRARWS